MISLLFIDLQFPHKSSKCPFHHHHHAYQLLWSDSLTGHAMQFEDLAFSIDEVHVKVIFMSIFFQVLDAGDDNIRGWGGGGQFPGRPRVEGGLTSQICWEKNISNLQKKSYNLQETLSKNLQKSTSWFCINLCYLNFWIYSWKFGPLFTGANHNKGWAGPWCEASWRRRGIH